MQKKGTATTEKIGPKSTLLIKLDYDYKDQRKIIEEMDLIRKMLGRMFNLKSFEVKETRRGYHVKLKIEPLINLDNKDIIIIQLLLGSDKYREFFNWIRVKGNQKHWNVLFDQKVEVKDIKTQKT
ncbi:hypothetical protein J7L33_04860 [Candidatus Bathyarchaeota archaeon]|nr:hypothetical protein [Candidatus Bathyarchaeota archaeon]